MEKLVFLIDSDFSLRENVTELLELEGYQVVHITSDDAKSFFQNYHKGLILLNMLTFDESIDSFIRFLKGKTDGIVVLCSDDEDPRIHEADIKIFMPFNNHEFLRQLSDFIDAKATSKA
ncbi:MAG: hypothetical protein ABJG78_15830 [Cyclobacteriaceae bacterium]